MTNQHIHFILHMWQIENEYQEYFLGGNAAGAWGWRPHHFRVPNVMEIWEPKPPGTLWNTPGLLWDSLSLYVINTARFIRSSSVGYNFTVRSHQILKGNTYKFIKSQDFIEPKRWLQTWKRQGKKFRTKSHNNPKSISKILCSQFNTIPHICFTCNVLSHFARQVTTAEIRAVRSMNTDEYQDPF